MPQIRLEYSANVTLPEDPDLLLSNLHGVLQDCGGISIGNCKSRVFCCRTFRVGRGGSAGAFIHLEVRILEGRSPELKRKIGGALLDVLRQAFEESREKEELQITVEICDIFRDAYFKDPDGTLTSR